MAPAASPFFIDRPAGGQCFCIHHAHAGARAHGQVLFVHAWADEMNKSRRMAALQARALAAAGYEVLAIDLLGCGDSSGDFGDASWDAWIDDVVTGARWLQARQPQAPLWLWGHRAGALLATAAAARLEAAAHFVFWHAAGSGKLLLQQFLRLKMAGELLDGKAKGVTEGLRQQLAAGQAVAVAGYTLAPALASGLEQATLAPPPRARTACFIELNPQPEVSALTPATATQVERWRAAGVAVSARVVTGPAFWQTTEIEDAPALIPATVAALRSHEAVPA